MPQSHVNKIIQARLLALIFVAISAAVLVAARFFTLPFSSPLFLVIHANVEQICIVLYALVFAVAWNAYGRNLYQNSILLAVTFFCAAVLDFLHLNLIPGIIWADGHGGNPIWF